MTQVIRCAADAAGRDFLVADDFLEAAACDALAETYCRSESLYEAWHTDPFWHGRLLGWRDVQAREDRFDVLRALNIAKGRAQCHYNVPDLYVDALHLVGWPTGWQMTPHADNAHESGEQHEFHWRDYSGVLYLNDDFEGGELYLPKQELMIRPRKGMFVSLPCGLSHIHGVMPITSGLRITMAFFLTKDRAHADHDLLVEEALG